jgi:adenylate kinase
MSIIQKNRFSDKLGDYSRAIIGEPGIGKTTVLYEVCEKLYGSEGYVFFNCGREQGVDCIDGIRYVSVPDYETFAKTCNELIENKETEYPDLKNVIIDTLDQLIEYTEPYVVKLWNYQNRGQEKFVAVTSINTVFGDFFKG